MCLRFVRLAGISLCVSSQEEILRSLLSAPKEGSQVAAPLGFSQMVRTSFSPKYQMSLASIDVHYPDSFFLYLLLKLKFRISSLRIFSSRLMINLLEQSSARGGSHFFLGMTSPRQRNLRKNLKRIIPELDIKGMVTSEIYRRRIEDFSILLRKITPDFVLVHASWRDSLAMTIRIQSGEWPPGVYFFCQKAMDIYASPFNRKAADILFRKIHSLFFFGLKFFKCLLFFPFYVYTLGIILFAKAHNEETKGER